MAPERELVGMEKCNVPKMQSMVEEIPHCYSGARRNLLGRMKVMVGDVSGFLDKCDSDLVI